MRKIFATLAVVSAFGAATVPATAQASGGHATPCAYNQGFVQYLGEMNTTCSVARTVERTWVNSQMAALGMPFHAAGRTWHVAWSSSTDTSITSGGRYVIVYHLPSN